MRTFRDHMESSLYAPERGFYPTRTQTADFYTAPELHPAYGAVLSDKIAALLARVRDARPGAGLSLVEAGCGDGTLACQVARGLREKHPALADGLRFVLMDRTRKDLTAAVRKLTAFGLPVDACTGIDHLPRFTGLLYSNELIDAFPAHLLQKKDGGVLEVYVDESGRETLGGLSRHELAAEAEAVASTLAEGERHGVSLEARAWLREAAARLESGFLLTIDYGKRFAPGTPNPPRAYRRHALVADLSSEPGTKDLTVPADFESLIAEGARAGLSLESYQSLSTFLIEGGIDAWLSAAAGDAASSYEERSRIKTLVHPEGMGEAFKVLLQRKSL